MMIIIGSTILPASSVRLANEGMKQTLLGFDLTNRPGTPLSRRRPFALNRNMLNSADPVFARLLDQARAMARASTHPNAGTLDVERWLTHWVTMPQPGLGGRRPEELLDTPGGGDAVARVLGAIQSGTVV